MHLVLQPGLMPQFMHPLMLQFASLSARIRSMTCRMTRGMTCRVAEAADQTCVSSTSAQIEVTTPHTRTQSR